MIIPHYPTSPFGADFIQKDHFLDADFLQNRWFSGADFLQKTSFLDADFCKFIFIFAFQELKKHSEYEIFATPHRY